MTISRSILPRLHSITTLRMERVAGSALRDITADYDTASGTLLQAIGHDARLYPREVPRGSLLWNTLSALCPPRQATAHLGPPGAP